MGIFRNAPPHLVRDHYKRQLAPGIVVRFEAQMSGGLVKYKRFVLVALADPKVHFFITNSRISQFVQGRPSILRCQALMPVSSHSFMTRDTNVDCHEAWTYDIHAILSEFVNETLGNGVNPILGRITLPMRDEIVRKLVRSPVLSPQERTDFSASLNSMV
jgi:hypothetical protein